MLLHYLGILKIQIFCKYSTGMEKCKQIAFSVYSFNSSVCITVYAECIKCFIKILSSSLNAMLIIDKIAVTSAVTYFRCTD